MVSPMIFSTLNGHKSSQYTLCVVYDHKPIYLVTSDIFHPRGKKSGHQFHGNVKLKIQFGNQNHRFPIQTHI